MPTSLLAALPADAVINHPVTGWQCPSLAWGWLRRAGSLPACQRTAPSWAGLLAGEAKAPGNVQTPLLCDFLHPFCNFPIHQPLRDSSLSCGYGTPSHWRSCLAQQRIFLEEEPLLFWNWVFAPPRGVKNTIATIEFLVFLRANLVLGVKENRKPFCVACI